MQPLLVQHGQQLLLMPFLVGADALCLRYLGEQAAVGLLRALLTALHLFHGKGEAEDPGQQHSAAHLVQVRLCLKAGVGPPDGGVTALLFAHPAQHGRVFGRLFLHNVGHPGIDKVLGELAHLHLFEQLQGLGGEGPFGVRSGHGNYLLERDHGAARAFAGARPFSGCTGSSRRPDPRLR